MATLRKEIDAACAPHGLTLLGTTAEADGTIALIGMRPDGWEVFTNSPEYRDGAPDALDRWSTRVLPKIGELTGAREVLYPFGGPPYQPFIRWAFDSAETFSSPVGMLVHHTAGFWISFRGALRLDATLPQPPADTPCPPCPQPCRTACPVGALAPGQDYDVPTCKAHIVTEAGRTCREGGCLVRRACPVSQAFGRDPAQSAFHMAAFIGA